MTALLNYSTGTVSIASGGTVVTGAGTIWNDGSAKPGDILQVGNFQSIISDVVDGDELTIPPWGGGAQAGAAYKIWQVSPQRFAGAEAMTTVNRLVAAIGDRRIPVVVGDTDTAPDPSLGEEGQFAYQPATGAWWEMTGGVWLSSVGPVAGYGGTSTTSLAIGTGSKVFTTQNGLAYDGARVRATAASDNTKWMEGVVDYSGTTLTMTVDKTGGSGTFASWTFAIAGQPGNDGDVVGPAAASDNAAARFNATTGKLIQDSALLIADTTGALSRSGGGGVPVQGTSTNDNAAAGDVGEYGSATTSVTPGVSFGATNTPTDIVSVSLPAGDYDVWGVAVYVPGGSSVVTQCLFWINTLSASRPGVDAGDLTGFGFGSGITGGAASHIAVEPKRISLSATTTVYLSGQVSCTGTIPGAGGTIKWRRRR